MVPHLELEIAGARLAISAASVVEIVRALATVALPGAPAMVEGVFGYRGALACALDLRARLGLPPRPPELGDHLVVARAGRRLVAIRVDRALGLVAIEPGAIVSAAEIAPGVRHVAGVAARSEGLVLIHDLETFLSAAEAAELDAALAAGAPLP